MLTRTSSPDKLITYGFLVAVEIDTSTEVTTEYVADKLADAVSWVEGTGKAEVQCIGPIPLYEEGVDVMENEGTPPVKGTE